MGSSFFARFDFSVFMDNLCDFNGLTVHITQIKDNRRI